jgi:hypothetical protein
MVTTFKKKKIKTAINYYLGHNVFRVLVFQKGGKYFRIGYIFMESLDNILPPNKFQYLKCCAAKEIYTSKPFKQYIDHKLFLNYEYTNNCVAGHDQTLKTSVRK